MQVITRLFHPTKTSFFLFGPRGTGKSTLMRTIYQNALWVDFLNPKTERIYAANPELLYDYIDANKNYNTIIIDEVQKVPAVLNVVHDLMEQRKNLQFVLTGSSARKIKRTGENLLAGRALSYSMYPFMANELGAKFNLELALEYGLVPIIIASNNKEETIQAYINLYLKEEIQIEGLTRNIDDFARFLEAISFSHASLINVSNIARECLVKRKTVESYINILEDLLLIYKLPVFTKRAKRELVNNHKVYLFDSGIYNALRPKGLLDKREEIDGAGLEGLVLQHLKAWDDYNVKKSNVCFWRTSSGVEVNFVVYGEKNFFAIEVKNTKNINLQDTKSLKIFLQEYPEAKAVLLYRGEEKIIRQGILCIPIEQFLLDLKPGLSLTEVLRLE